MHSAFAVGRCGKECAVGDSGPHMGQAVHGAKSFPVYIGSPLARRHRERQMRAVDASCMNNICQVKIIYTNTLKVDILYVETIL